ncbi:MAG: hypothetical protein E7256_14380 [Lachnospiraceae bacterium]|nr:hypothetical protein [Lachnospiraceae bacterium]
MKEKNGTEDLEEIQKITESGESPFEKNDRLAMMLSAFLVFLPAAAVILGIFAGIVWIIDKI